jgi:spermidine synthase
MLYTVIFLSGGAILALELLASRIMTPYFGVSLYIWTGILSITLISLALGYWLGGRYAQSTAGRAIDRLLQCYAMMPALAALSIVVACLAYPHLFSSLAGWSLIFGSFAACMILLFLPLVATSAMNPLLVAISLQSTTHRAGDAGAGRVFFMSTIGSVAGVLVTAFVMTPYLSNYVAVLTVALALALLTLALAAVPSIRLNGRTAIALTGIVAAGASILLMWQADAYTGRAQAVAYAGRTWQVEASYGSLFGTVKILRSRPEGESGEFLRIYFQDGLTQNTVDSNGRSLSFYTYGLEALAWAHRPAMRSALVLGLGAGIVPMELAQRGVAVDVVEIDPASLYLAQRYFGFDPARARVHHADARAFVRRCPKRYDTVVVDLFHGDGTPDYLVTREFFSDLKRCLAKGGVAVFNTFADLERPAGYAHLLKTLSAELPAVTVYRPDWRALQLNSFLVAGAAQLSQPAKVTLDYVPERHADTLWNMLANPRPLDGEMLKDGRIVSDALNAAAHDFAVTQLAYRRSVVEAVPPALLMN